MNHYTSHSIMLTGLAAETTYHYQVTSADGSGNTASSADFTFTTTSAPVDPTDVSVDSITYFTSGGRFKDKHLSITVALLDNLSDPVAGASVSITLYLNDSPDGSGTGTTGTDGTVTFTRNNAPSGTYTTTVTDVTADALIWDGVTPDNSFDKMSASVTIALVAAEANAETPADASRAIPVFFVVETTQSVKTVLTNGDAESNAVVLSVVTSADWNAAETDSVDLISDDSDDLLTDDSEPVIVLPQDLDEIFTDLLRIEWGLL